LDHEGTKDVQGFLEFLCRKSFSAEMQNESKMNVSGRGCYQLGLECQKMQLIYFCFALLNHMLSWFLLNDMICNFANLYQSGMEGVFMVEWACEMVVHDIC